jgi:hypothetical protein
MASQPLGLSGLGAVSGGLTWVVGSFSGGGSGKGVGNDGAGTGAGDGTDGGAPIRSDSQAVSAMSAPSASARRSIMTAGWCTMRRSISQRRDEIIFKMFWLVLEAGVALAILIVIVWWTWPRPPRDDGDHRD